MQGRWSQEGDIVSPDIQGMPERYRRVFRNATFWADAPDAAIDQLAAASIVHECARGELIFREGSPADRVLVVLTGQVRSVHHTPDGHSVFLENSSPGEVIGPIGAYTDRPFEADIEAGSGTVIALFPMRLLDELIREEPRLALSVIRGIAHRWLTVVDIAKRNSAEVPTRLARFLLELPPVRTPNGTRLVELPCSRVELATMLATSPETLSRTFHRLADDHIIEAYQRSVRLNDVRALERIAEGEMLG